VHEDRTMRTYNRIGVLMTDKNNVENHLESIELSIINLEKSMKRSNERIERSIEYIFYTFLVYVFVKLFL
jgi:hypothetical protein